MTPREKRERWPFLDEDRTQHITTDGEALSLPAPLLQPDRYRRVNITADYPKEDYSQHVRKM